MAKTTKGTTKKETTVTKEVVTNTTEKGGTKMTVQIALKKLMIDYNNYQEYRKKQGQSYSYVTQEQMITWAKRLTTDELIKLAKTYLYQRNMQQRLNNYLFNERLLNKVYGQEDINIMELTDEEREYINKRRARQAKKGGAQ